MGVVLEKGQVRNATAAAGVKIRKVQVRVDGNTYHFDKIVELGRVLPLFSNDGKKWANSNPGETTNTSLCHRRQQRNGRRL